MNEQTNNEIENEYDAIPNGERSTPLTYYTDEHMQYDIARQSLWIVHSLYFACLFQMKWKRFRLDARR